MPICVVLLLSSAPLSVQHKSCTVLVVSNCIEHDGTSYAVLKCVELEF